MPGFPPGGLAPSPASPSREERLAQAEASVRNFCRWHISPILTTKVDVEGSDYRTQVLRTRHLVAVTDVMLNSTPLVEGVNFAIDEIGILRRIDGGTFTGRLTLTMSHGWVTPPKDVQGVIADMAASGGIGAVGAQKQSAGPFSIDLGTGHVAQAGGVGLSTEQRRILSRYALEPGLF